MTEIYVKGHITEVMPLQQGTTEKGSWERQDYVVTPSEGGRPLCFSIVGHDRIQQAGLAQGQECVLRLFVESRPYTNKETGQVLLRLFVESRPYTNKETGQISRFTQVTYGGLYGMPHWQFYNQVMYSLRPPGFGTTQGYEIRPVQLQQQSFQYAAVQQPPRPRQGSYGSPAGGYGQQPGGGVYYRDQSGNGNDGLPF